MCCSVKSTAACTCGRLFWAAGTILPASQADSSNEVAQHVVSNMNYFNSNIASTEPAELERKDMT